MEWFSLHLPHLHIRYGSDGLYVDINGYIDDQDVVIQVINYGDVIPPDILPHLFDMFFTGDQSRTHQEGSTGLGLFITKNIVSQHNGTISAESNVVRTLVEVIAIATSACSRVAFPIADQ